MFHNHKEEFMDKQELAVLGADAIAYMRKISTEEMEQAFPGAVELPAGEKYWALFAANGDPIMLSSELHEITDSAFYSDLEAVRPN
ncbi:MAG: DUF1150 family protein [Pseudomonadota bacterium]